MCCKRERENRFWRWDEACPAPGAVFLVQDDFRFIRMILIINMTALPIPVVMVKIRFNKSSNKK